ncbi:2-phospho-L-lactate transferase [Rhizorhabdus sp. FW153]|uniref:2-phospho-L-lactate transferase n=1 Tax=Rhizorhabdus sp. FW153 TaxID=3400216 RepID=UPI003CEA0502
MIVALAGGVGGARMAHGLAACLPPDDLLVVVNVGDDFEHLGLPICPDLDTVCYTLAGRNDRERGWGFAGESWSFMAAIRDLGGEDWFNLGDRDLATHIIRRTLLETQSLSDVTRHIADRLGIAHPIVPATDDRLRSIVHSEEGVLAFQDYFVRRRAEPVFTSIRFEGAEAARPSPAFDAALDDPALEAVILCPSNPILSIAPILAIGDVRDRLRRSPAPVVAVSPFIDGDAIKGPAAKIFKELHIPCNPQGLISCLGDVVDALVIDGADAAASCPDLPVLVTDTLMRDDAGQQRLAREVLAFARSLKR